jgi:hypothetical protein
MTITFRTARIAHLCDTCHWTPSLRNVATILPGHRYLLHKAFPGGEGSEEAVHPYTNNECIACALERSYGEDLAAGACGSFCCGDVPCAKPVHHQGNHSCRRDAEDVARDLVATTTASNPSPGGTP